MTKQKTAKFEIIFFKLLGISISLLGLSMYFIPMFWEIKKDYTKDGWYIPILIITFGISVFLYYKKLGSLGIDYLESKADKGDETGRPEGKKDDTI